MAKNQFIRLTALTLAGALLGSMAVFSASGAEVKTEEAVGYYETYGSQTMLESAGISYASYIKWLEDHDDLSDDPLYYLGTPFVGYFEGTPFEGDDYRTPNGESYAYGMEPPSYAPYNGHGMQCTGFVWNVLTNAGKAAMTGTRAFSTEKRPLTTASGIPARRTALNPSTAFRRSWAAERCRA